MDKIREKPVEILVGFGGVVGLIIVGTAGFVLKEMYDLNANQRATDERVAAAMGRIDRIASVLPDIRIRIAKEETAAPLRAAVVVANPVKAASGRWVTPVHLIDIGARQRHTYLIGVSGPDDWTAAHLASGAGLFLEKNAVSFESLKEWSAEAQEPTSLPDWLVTSHSLALRHPKSDFAKTFDKAIHNAAKDAVTENATVPLEGSSWNKLTLELNVNAKVYTKLK